MGIHAIKRSGFTIAEVLLVALVIGLIASSGTGLYIGTFRQLRVKRAAYDLFLTAQYARILAIEQTRRHTLQLDTNGQAFWLSTLAENDEGQAVEQIVKDPYCKPVQMAGQVVFEAVQVTQRDLEGGNEEEEQTGVVFSPDGTAQAAVIQIGDGKTHYTISVSAATGRTRMVYGTSENVQMTSIDLDEES